jgi:hypothetical protein
MSWTAKKKLQMLCEMCELRHKDLLAIPINVSGESGYVIARAHPKIEGACAPIAFILPDDIGNMFMDSEVFKSRRVVNEADGVSSDLSDGAGAGEAADSGATFHVVELQQQEDGTLRPTAIDGKPTVASAMPPQLRQILSKLNDMADFLDTLEKIRERVQRHESESSGESSDPGDKGGSGSGGGSGMVN